MVAAVVAFIGQFRIPLSARASILTIVLISTSPDLISNPAVRADVISEFRGTNVFAPVDGWFGISEAEGHATIGSIR